MIVGGALLLDRVANFHLHQHAADLVGRKKIRVFSADLDSEASSRQRASAFTTRDSTPNSTISVTEYGRFRIRDPYSA